MAGTGVAAWESADKAVPCPDYVFVCRDVCAVVVSLKLFNY